MAESSVPGAVGERPDAVKLLRRLVAVVDAAGMVWHDPVPADSITAIHDAKEFLAGGAVGEREEPPLDVADVIAALGSWPGTLDVGGQRAEFVDHVHRALVARLSVNEGGSPVARTEAEPHE